MLQVKVLRGLPGAGKSTYVEQLRQTIDVKSKFMICSADSYHINEQGVYEFKIENMAAAHRRCLRRFVNMLESWNPEDDDDEHHDYLIVDNTNLRLSDVSPYYRLAEAYGAPVEIIWFVTPIDVCLARQRHGVPPEKIEAMFLTTEALPADWKVTVRSS